MREKILTSARQLTLERGAVPSLDAVASAAGVSKGGLMHHFPTRAALVVGLARVALDDVDAAMTQAAGKGRAARTWLELSMVTGAERELMQALASGFRPSDAAAAELLADATAAITRWEKLIELEVGDEMQARTIRLVGDALVANALAGVDVAGDPEELIAYVTRPARS